MPKLLFNIENRIFISAKELFYEKGYDQVNMREISKRADIAVGTLYNYFANKSELYISVLESSWNDTFEKLDYILTEDMEGREKLKSYIELLYEEVFERKCVGMEIRKTGDLKHNKAVKKIEEDIRVKIKGVFKDLNLKKQFKNDENILDKIVINLLISLTMLIEYYPKARQENIVYIYTSISGYFE